ncbi:MAG: toxin-antitoxin system HicB family antitoxin [Anaerolineales bacterium]|nr:toxin-antitoxin system HicB family antitoxin [Anaerolineales bacterium]MCB9128125.1 toxin-antitoxin system HicB family antitoxin [Ardenticatenales bacterium]MCB9171835.1 toxin-antitoxin system HicB family antitoxin [Ardenticatenales bacterium]
MSTLSVRLPDALHNEVRELAESNNTSMNQLITLAVAEKVAALRTVDYLKARGEKGSRDAYLAVLAKAP